jgi:hypothetical protein
LTSLVETIAAIANAGPDGEGFIDIGIADKKADVERIVELDGIDVVGFEHLAVVGVDRESAILDIPLEKHLKIIGDAIVNSKLSEPLKTQVCAGIDVITYRELSVVRIRVPRQQGPSFVGDECFIRRDSSTVRASGPQIASVSRLFRS